MTDGQYVNRRTRVFRVLLLLACVIFGTIFGIGGLAFFFMLRATLLGIVLTVLGVGVTALAFYQRERWHIRDHRLE